MNLPFAIPMLLAEAGVLPSEWEPGGTIMLRIAAILLLVALNGFFVAAEFALVKVRTAQVDVLAEEGSKRATVVRHVLSHLDSYLSASQLGITLASLALGWVGEPYLSALLAPLFYKIGIVNAGAVHTICVVLGFAGITSLHITLGEQVPKILAIRRPLPMALFISQPLRWFTLVFKPAIWFLNAASNWMLKTVFRIDSVNESEIAHSEEELRVILAESARADEVTPMGKELLMNALDLQKRVVRDITTPRGDVMFLNTEDTFDENLKRAMDSRHTRFPLCREHLDETIGLVHIKDLLRLMREPKPDITSIKRDLHNVPEMMPLEKLLSFFLARHAHLALVVDEFGGTAGIVTLDNVIEELVGDIQDEFDADKPEMRRVSQDEFVIAATLSLHELNDMLGMELESTEVSTVGGYITQIIGHLPKTGEKTHIDDFDATVTKADGRRVLEVHFKRTAAGGESPLRKP
jgi:CBS domain containing-hemolysin-like protein